MPWLTEFPTRAVTDVLALMTGSYDGGAEPLAEDFMDVLSYGFGQYFKYRNGDEHDDIDPVRRMMSAAPVLDGEPAMSKEECADYLQALLDHHSEAEAAPEDAEVTEDAAPEGAEAATADDVTAPADETCADAVEAPKFSAAAFPWASLIATLLPLLLQLFNKKSG